jgi:hypothetical protein
MAAYGEIPMAAVSSAGTNSKEGSWVQWLTRIREVNGTIACQESDDQPRCQGWGVAGPA